MIETIQKILTNNCTIFNRDRVILAIQHLKVDKASGFDDLICKSLKFAYCKLVDVLCFLFSKCYKRSWVPTYICNGKIIPMPKKFSALLMHTS